MKAVKPLITRALKKGLLISVPSMSIGCSDYSVPATDVQYGLRIPLYSYYVQMAERSPLSNGQYESIINLRMKDILLSSWKASLLQ